MVMNNISKGSCVSRGERCSIDQNPPHKKGVLREDHLILTGGGGLALFGNKYSDLENAGNK